MGLHAHTPKLPYRPEIDGLRAVAVVSVILYHSRFLPWGTDPFAGGYLGVDIFFVISGYLIARIILSERMATGSFSFAGFYERRARRILPALLLVILASIPFAWAWLLPTALVEFARSILSTLLFYSNFFFNRVTQSYGAEDSLLKPLLHTWSLSIEEQFYIFFPAVLVLALRFLKSGTRYLIALLLILSLGCAQYFARENPSLNFFLSPSRFWELFAGAFLASVELGGGWKRLQRWSGLLSGLGAVMLAGALAGFGENTPHPSLLTVIPVLGTALIIGFASQQDVVGKALGLGLLRGIGLISYSLYLWHYPVLGFWRVKFGEPDTVMKLGLIALITLLSVFSYVAVERPFRNRSLVPLRVFLAVILPLYAGLLLFGWLTAAREGFPSRFSYTGAFAHFNLDNEKLQEDSQKGVKARKRNDPMFHDVPDKVLIVGNSHAKDMFNALSQNAGQFAGFDFLVGNAQQIACLAEGNVPEKYSRQRDAFYASPQYAAATTILVSTRYDFRRCDRLADPGVIPSDLEVLPSLIARARKDGKKVVVMGNTAQFLPVDGQTAADYVYRKYGEDPASKDPASFPAYKEEADRLMYSRLDPKTAATNARLRQIANDAGVPFVDKVPLVCDESAGTCSAFTDDGHKTLYDYGHWTMQGAAYFGKRLADDPSFRALIAR